MKCAIIVLVWAVTLSFAPSTTFGQSALEKLEQKVREQLGEKKPEDPAEELPSPQRSVDQSSSNSSSVSPATNLTRPPDLGSLGPADRTGQIYLGLEAEQPVGGGIGVRVSSITPQSPAWKAGFEIGDRILAVRNFAITNLDSMVEQLIKASPGEAVRFLVLRKGRNIDLTAVLMDASLAARLYESAEPDPINGNTIITEPGWLGVVVNDLTPAFRQQFAIPVFIGAAVTMVTAGSPAQKEGIRAGDVITEANGQPIEGERDLLTWMAGRRAGESVELIVYRGSAFRRVMLTLEVNPDNRKKQASNRSPIPETTSQNTLTFDSKPAPSSQLPAVVNPFPVLQASTPESDASDTPGATELADDQNQSDALARDNARLRQANLQLQAELEAARKRLAEAEKQLSGILEALKGEKSK